jgi:hypothetical protein
MNIYWYRTIRLCMPCITEYIHPQSIHICNRLFTNYIRICQRVVYKFQTTTMNTSSTNTTHNTSNSLQNIKPALKTESWPDYSQAITIISL